MSVMMTAQDVIDHAKYARRVVYDIDEVQRRVMLPLLRRTAEILQAAAVDIPAGTFEEAYAYGASLEYGLKPNKAAH